MNRNFSIITVGLSPAWDILCYGEGLEWGLHREIKTTKFQPAGKALNISQALAWMGKKALRPVCGAEMIMNKC
jgi:fructose-1-phosphate kinase PfkB-like protein